MILHVRGDKQLNANNVKWLFDITLVQLAQQTSITIIVNSVLLVYSCNMTHITIKSTIMATTILLDEAIQQIIVVVIIDGILCSIEARLHMVYNICHVSLAT